MTELAEGKSSWQLFVVLHMSENASRIREQFFEFLGRPRQLTFYIPRLSIKVVAKFPGILTERASPARLICRSRHIGFSSRAPSHKLD
jgi:hypothetical protein